MLHIALRLLLWIAVLVAGYLLLGPDGFDSSGDANPFATQEPLYLPPVRPARLIELEQAMQEGATDATAMAEYQALVRERQAGFWKGDGLTLESALAGVERGRRDRLIGLLRERGASDEEISVFLGVVARDRPKLLVDRD